MFPAHKITFLQWHSEIKAQGVRCCWAPRLGGGPFPSNPSLGRLSSIPELAYSQSSLFLEKPRLPLTKQAVLAVSGFCCHCQCRQLHVAVSTSGWVLRLTVLAAGSTDSKGCKAEAWGAQFLGNFGKGGGKPRQLCQGPSGTVTSHPLPPSSQFTTSPHVGHQNQLLGMLFLKGDGLE